MLHCFMTYSVITHAGRAHIDEILAMAFLSIHFKAMPQAITRLDQSDVKAMVDAGRVPDTTWVIDCGMIYDPSKRLIDHHQDGQLPSAAMLVFNEFFPELQGSSLHKYIDLVSRVDTGGIRSLGDTTLAREAEEYWSFCHNLLTRFFENNPLAALGIFREGMIEKIRFEEEKKNAAEWLDFPGRLKVVEVEGLTVLAYTERPPETLRNGVRSLDRQLVEKHQAVAIYGYDDREDSVRSLYRTEWGYNKIDFIEAKPRKLLFNHQSGFLLRFIPADDKEWERLISQARK